jgi:hypothetical protein
MGCNRDLYVPANAGVLRWKSAASRMQLSTLHWLSPALCPQHLRLGSQLCPCPCANTQVHCFHDASLLYCHHAPTPRWTPPGTAVFPYTITDAGTALNATANVHVTIPTPSPPVAVNDAYTCTYGNQCSPPTPQSILDNDASTAGGALTVDQVVTPPLVGAVTVTPSGSFTYTPPL